MLLGMNSFEGQEAIQVQLQTYFSDSQSQQLSQESIEWLSKQLSSYKNNQSNAATRSADSEDILKAYVISTNGVFATLYQLKESRHNALLHIGRIKKIDDVDDVGFYCTIPYLKSIESLEFNQNNQLQFKLREPNRKKTICLIQ